MKKRLKLQRQLGPVEVKRDKKKSSILHAYESIQKEVDRGRAWFQTQICKMLNNILALRTIFNYRGR